MRKFSLQTKLSLSFVLLMVLLFLCQLIFNVYFAKEYYVGHMSDVMREAYEAIEASYNGDTEDIEDILRSYENNYNIDFHVNNGGETPLYTTSNRFPLHQGEAGGPGPPTPPQAQDMPEELDTELSASTPTLVMHEGGRPGNNTMLLRLVDSFDNTGETITVAMSLTLDSIENSVALLTGAGMVITAVVLVVGLLFFFALSRTITKPIDDIGAAAARITHLDFSQPVEEAQGSKELSSLAENINTMASRLQHAIEDLSSANEQLQDDLGAQKKLEGMRREFVANVSHEMKTPLALLQIYADNLKNNVNTEDKDEYCAVIVEESEKLSNMVSSMLDVSALENGLSVVEKEALSLSDLVKTHLDKMELLIQGHPFTRRIESGLFVLGDAYYLEQAMKNFLTNALEHTPQGGCIEVRLYKKENKAIFSVYNEGSFLAEEDFPHLWSSFYRSDKARVRENGNVGMGLHIVKTVVERHEGHCEAKNEKEGVLFSFTLPILREE